MPQFSNPGSFGEIRANTRSVQGAEVRYELQSLGWKSFQDLCSTITSEILGQTVQIFMPTKDGGRDGAFNGSWKPAKNETITGSFVVQCKFTGKRDAVLTREAVSEEFAKAKALAARGLADNYILMTNYGVSGVLESDLHECFLAIKGVQTFLAFGRDWINQKIRESARLRMMVPRVYGLGDLSQILDERAYAQATDILSSLDDDLVTFVITDAHRQSVRALVERGFVLLLGEPASGKSTIAASLSLGAIDLFDCSTVKTRNPEEFVRHWNPHNPNQFFWVDDGFGATQYQRELAIEWNHALPHLKAAVRKGARVVFTSRDYIFNAAKRDLKLTAFPLFMDSQVVINVQHLSKAEREQILYNHVKLGDQPKEFKAEIKSHLPAVANHHDFRPEIARRLGNRFFTNNLVPCLDTLLTFVAQPVGFLKDIICTLDAESKAAIAVIFMSGGNLDSPIELTSKLEKTIEMLGGTSSAVRHSMTALRGSLTKLVTSEGRKAWTFRHPTIADAFAEIVAEDPELMDIYLEGAKIEKLIQEVVAGDVSLVGAKVVVPEPRYVDLANRINRELSIDRICGFLGSRCSRSFLKFYFKACPNVLDHVCAPGSWLHATLETDLLPKLQEYDLLPSGRRHQLIERVTELATTTPDADFLTVERVKQVFTAEEIQSFTASIRKDVIPRLDDIVWEWKSNYDTRQEPEEYFQLLTEALSAYLVEFADDSDAVAAIQENLERIQSFIVELDEDRPHMEPDWDDDMRSPTLPSGTDRSVFDDVDEFDTGLGVSKWHGCRPCGPLGEGTDS